MAVVTFAAPDPRPVPAAVAELGATRDPFIPQRPPGMRLGLLLALVAHALLVVGLAFSVDWHGAEPSAVQAELWSGVPRQAAPRAVEPTPAPSPPVARRLEAPTAPAVRPQPARPAPPPTVDPQIAIEKARQVEAQREVSEQEQLRREKARRDQSRQLEFERQQAERERQQRKEQELARDRQTREVQEREKQEREKQEREKQERSRQAKDEQARKKTLADKAVAERAAADSAQQAAARAAYLKRIQGLAGAPGVAGATGPSGSTGGSARSSGPSAGYAGRIMARIKPNIVFPDAVAGNPTATVEVRVAPDGSITSRRLVQSSGVKAWDDAVLRAIDRTDGLPRDIDGRVEPVMLIAFKRD